MLVLSWLLGAVVWFWLVKRYDRFEPEPLRCLLAVGLVGGLASGLLASLGNHIATVVLGIDGGVGAVVAGRAPPAVLPLLAIFVGFNEEVLKAFAAVALTRRLGDLDEPIDAPLYAMMTALGFSVIENLDYATSLGHAVLLPRYLLSTSVHVALAVIWGTAWARGHFLEPQTPLWQVMAPTVALAATLHGVWDFACFSGFGPGIALAVVGLIALVSWGHSAQKAMAMETPFLRAGTCPRCGGIGKPGARYCGSCGGKVPSRYFLRCGACGANMPRAARFCPACGSPAGPASGSPRTPSSRERAASSLREPAP